MNGESDWSVPLRMLLLYMWGLVIVNSIVMIMRRLTSGAVLSQGHHDCLPFHARPSSCSRCPWPTNERFSSFLQPQENCQWITAIT